MVEIPPLSRAQSQQVDRRAIEHRGVSSLVLMENAGRGVVDRLEQLGIGGPVVICCGRGNNGGDGLVAARHLDLRGHEVRVLLWGDPQRLSPDALANFEILAQTQVPILRQGDQFDGGQLRRHLAGAAWIIDALLGTGATGDPRPPLDQVISALNAAPAPILAADVPSGLDCDTGKPGTPTIRAAHTCTFAAQKIGFREAAAHEFLGRVSVLDIGIPPEWIAEIASDSP